MNTGKKILDVTCGSRTIWFDKHHPAALYCDNRREKDSRIWKSGDGKSERLLTVDPDVLCDFTALPFTDGSFSLVVWDPPTSFMWGTVLGWQRNTESWARTGHKCSGTGFGNVCGS